MPRKRKADAMQSKPETSKQLAENKEHEESLVPRVRRPHRVGQNPNPSHSHPDVPLPSIEPSSSNIPSSSPIERHVKRRSAISLDLRRANFPRDEDGFIAQVPYAVPGRDISPYSAHIRSGGSPVPYNSRDYGPRAASTPTVEAGETPQGSEGFEGVINDGSIGEDDEGEHMHEDCHEPDHDLAEVDDRPVNLDRNKSPVIPYLGSSKLEWDLANSEPRRMLGRPRPPSSPLASESGNSSPEIPPHRNETGPSKDPPKATSRKAATVGPSTKLRGGLIEEGGNAIVALQRNSFISSRGNEYFCEIDEDYLTDRFNLTGLNTDVQYYQYALDLVTDVFDLDCDDDMREQIEKSARHLYGLVHARYITTTRGLAKMLEKYKKCDFGKCPRVMCQNHPLLPTGMADLPHVQSVKLYCGKCEDLYNPKSSRHSTIDGAYFGTSFQNILFQVYPALIPEKSTRRYEPRIFGFKVHAAAALERWQSKKREDMQGRLKEVGMDKVFKEDVADSAGEEMEEDDGEEGDGFVE